MSKKAYVATGLLAVIACAAAFYLYVTEPGLPPYPLHYQQPTAATLAALKRDHDTRLVLDESELNLAAQHARGRLSGDSLAYLNLALHEGRLELDTAWRLPGPRYLYSRASVAPAVNSWQLAALSLGPLTVPEALLPAAQRRLLAWLGGQPGWQFLPRAQALVTGIELAPGAAAVDWSLADGTGQSLTGDTLVGDYLAAMTDLFDPSLAVTVTRLFRRAQARSDDADDAARENLAALYILAVQGADPRLGRLAGWPQALELPALELAGREDLAQHFCTSIALVLLVGPEITELVGLYKELSDSRDRPRFDPRDLAADRAAIRLAALASDPDTAEALQRRLAAGATDTGLVPDTAALAKGDLGDILLLGKAGLSHDGLQAMHAAVDGLIEQSPIYAEGARK